MRVAGWICAMAAVFGLQLGVASASDDEQFFASISYDNKKIGQFHVRISRGDGDEIEEIRARASVSVLGFKLYEFTQDLTHTWKDGELQGMHGQVDNNGTTYDVELKRTENGLDGSVNGESIELPGDAFPNSLWHYGVIDHTPLFDEITLETLKVSVDVTDDNIDYGGKAIDTTKAVFTGDVKATVWFDENKNFVKGTMELDGRTLNVDREPDS